MTAQPAMTIAPPYLAASTVEDHHAHLAQLAGSAAWTLRTTPQATIATSSCGLVTARADRSDDTDAAHLFLSARARPAGLTRWKASFGGDLPVEFLTRMTTVLTAELLRDPGYVLYGLPCDGRLVPLPGGDAAGWDYRTDRDLLEWQTRNRGSRAMALLRDRDSTAPPPAGGEDTLMMAAATIAAPGGTDVVWWAGFSHGTPPPVTGTFLSALLAPGPLTRPAGSFLRPDLLPLVTTSREAVPSAGHNPPGPAGGPGPHRGQGSR